MWQKHRPHGPITISTSLDLIGPTSLFNGWPYGASTSVNDIRSVALGLQICGLPLLPDCPIPPMEEGAIRSVGKQRPELAVSSSGDLRSHDPYAKQSRVCRDPKLTWTAHPRARAAVAARRPRFVVLLEALRKDETDAFSSRILSCNRAIGVVWKQTADECPGWSRRFGRVIWR